MVEFRPFVLFAVALGLGEPSFIEPGLLSHCGTKLSKGFYMLTLYLGRGHRRHSDIASAPGALNFHELPVQSIPYLNVFDRDALLAQITTSCYQFDNIPLRDPMVISTEEGIVQYFTD